MATFLQNSTDTRPEQHLYQPDYGFLTQVMGVQQQRYDEGFMKVKSLYNSMLNGELTNTENITHRDETFKKLETQLRELSKSDLSQSSNVRRAVTLFDPLTKDPDIIADMRATQQYRQEMSKAERAMNSLDPKIRGTYSEYSRRDIEHGREDLLGAKRGTGQMQQVQMHKFTAFQNVDEYLDKRAKDQGFKIVYDKQNGPYLVKTTNGKETAPIFAQWAAQAMGTQFDAQFQVEARVTYEDKIRSMTRQGVPRVEATRMVAEQAYPKLLEEVSKRVIHGSTELDDVNVKIENMRKNANEQGGGRVLESEEVEWQKLLAQKAQLEEHVSGEKTDEQTLMSPQAMEFLQNNMQGALFKELKYAKATQWGTTHALLTSESEVRVDQWKLTQFTEQNQNMRHQQSLTYNYDKLNADLRMEGMKMDQQERFHGDDIGLRSRALDQQQGQYEATNEIRWAEVGLKSAAAGGTGGGAGGVRPGQGAGSIQAIGTYTDGSKMTGVEVVRNKHQAVRDQMFDASFDVHNSMAAILYPDNMGQVAELNTLAEKLRQASGGAQVRFDADDQRNLAEFGKRFNIQGLVVPKNQAYAGETLRTMSLAMASRLPKLLKDGLHNGTYTPEQVKSALRGVAMTTKSFEEEPKLREEIIRINSHIRNSDGSLNARYRGATAIGFDRNGLPLYDASTITDPQIRESLNQVVGKSYLNETGLSGTAYTVQKPARNSIVKLLSPNEGTVKAGDPALLAQLRALPGETMQKAIGEEMIMRVNPTKGTSTFVINIDPNNPLSKGKDASMPGAGTIEIEMDNKKILANPDMQAFHGKIQSNTHQWSDLASLTGLDKGKPGKAPELIRGIGFDYVVSEVSTSRGKEIMIQTKALDPKDNQWKIIDNGKKPVLIPGSLSDPQNAIRADKYIWGMLDYTLDGNVKYQQMLRAAKLREQQQAATSSSRK